MTNAFRHPFLLALFCVIGCPMTSDSPDAGTVPIDRFPAAPVCNGSIVPSFRFAFDDPCGPRAPLIESFVVAGFDEGGPPPDTEVDVENCGDGGMLLTSEDGVVGIFVPGEAARLPQTNERVRLTMINALEPTENYLVVRDLDGELLFEGGNADGRFPDERRLLFVPATSGGCTDDRGITRAAASVTFAVDDRDVALGDSSSTSVTVAGRPMFAGVIHASSLSGPACCDFSASLASAYLIADATRPGGARRRSSCPSAPRTP